MQVTDQSLLTVEDFMRKTCVGRTTANKLIMSGAVKSVKLGKRRLIPTLALSDFIAGLEARAAA